MEELLKEILAELRTLNENSAVTSFEYSDVFIVGGPTGTYFCPNPFNTECEWTVMAAAQGASSGNAVVSPRQVPTNLPTANGSGVSIGLSSGGTENNPLVGYVINMGANSIVPFTPAFVPLGSQQRGIYVLTNQGAANSTYVMIQFRRLIHRYIPEKPHIKPATHTHPQSQAPLRRLPAQSQMVAGYESKYPLLGEKVPYQQRGRRMIPERGLGVVPETQDTDAPTRKGGAGSLQDRKGIRNG